MTRTILIRGDTTEGWLAALWFARRHRSAFRVRVAAGPDDAPPARAYASPPLFGRFHQALGFDERDVLASCLGTFRFGTRYEGASGPIGFGPLAAPVGGAAFHQHVFRVAEADGGGPALAAVHSGTALAASGLAAFGEDAPPYGLHVDGAAYLRYLRGAGRHHGVAAGGDDGQADLVVDAAGWRDGGRWSEEPRGGTTGTVTHVRYGAPLGSATLPLADRDVTYREERAPQPVEASGPTGGAVALPCPPGPSPVHALRAAQIGIEAFSGLLSGGFGDVARREHERRVAEGLGRLTAWRDLCFSLATGAPCATEEARRKVEQFGSRGRIVTFDAETHDAGEHAALFMAFGRVPDRIDALAAHLPLEGSRRLIDEERAKVTALLARATPHDALLARLSRRRAS